VALRQRLEEGVEQVLAARDVAVQRHRLDAQRAAEAAHRERVAALGLDELERGVDHAGAAERLAGRRHTM
jgi:hypothetical protein